MASQQSQQIPGEFEKGFLPPLQDQESLPGKQLKLDPPPIDAITADGKPYKSAGKLEGRKVIVTGGDSGIGRAIVLLFGASTKESRAIIRSLRPSVASP